MKFVIRAIDLSAEYNFGSYLRNVTHYLYEIQV
jgi:hypothetical protein